MLCIFDGFPNAPFFALLLFPPNIASYLDPASVQRTPNSPHALIHTRHRPRHPLVLLPAIIPQQLRLSLNPLGRKIPHTDTLLSAVDVVGYYDGVLVGSWRDCDFDGWVAGSEGGESVAEKRVHASGGAGPVAVVEGERFALEDESTYAVLWRLEMVVG
jgi:hypothetical protein